MRGAGTTITRGKEDRALLYHLYRCIEQYGDTEQSNSLDIKNTRFWYHVCVISADADKRGHVLIGRLYRLYRCIEQYGDTEQSNGKYYF